VHVVVMGCGRVGSAIARRLEDVGHSVAVIDQDPAAFRRLGPEFGGRQVTGLGFDRQTLLDAGIDSAGAFAAVSSGDNSNIISARVARETFGVQHVVARIYDSKRAEVYERMGIPSVATVPWTVNRLLRELLSEKVSEMWREPTGQVLLMRVTVTPANRTEVMQLCDIFRAKIVDVQHEVLGIEVTGNESKIEKFLMLMGKFGISELSRTGRVALARKPN